MWGRNVLTPLQPPPQRCQPPPTPHPPHTHTPISHLMCGGCWDSHAKMNNNRLLVTTEHEHTRRLSLRLPSLSSPVSPPLPFSPTRSSSDFFVIYEHIQIPFLSSVSLCASVSLSRLAKVKHWHLGWRSHHTFRSSTLHSWPVISAVGDTAQLTKCACVRLRAFFFSFAVQYQLWVVQHLQTLSVLVDWDKSVRNHIDCGVYWNATNKVCSSNI